MQHGYWRLPIAFLAVAAISGAARADIPPPEEQIFSSGMTWVVLGVLVAAIAGVIFYRRKR